MMHKRSQRPVALKAGLLSVFTCAALFGSFMVNRSVAASSCSELEFIPVKPHYLGVDLPFDSTRRNIDKFKYDLKKSFSRISKTQNLQGLSAIHLKRDNDTPRLYKSALDPLRNSTAIQTINRLRIEAREISGYVAPCEPHLIYLGDRPIFGVGPAFVDSVRYMMDGREYSNWIVAENASLGPISLFSQESLQRYGYYDIVYAHEIAHGLMQDLYGVTDFKALAEKSVTRDGHMSSAVTDPALAWMEGFAEAFEAYLGEGRFPHQGLNLPVLNQVSKTISSAGDVFLEKGWVSYIFGAVPFVFKDTIKMISNFNDFTAEFLINERQHPTRDNHYILQGMVNLAHLHDMPPAFLADAEVDAIFNWTPETYDALFSKEGVVAHIIFQILKRGWHHELFTTIAREKPQNFHEFLMAMPVAFSSQQLQELTPVLTTTFTAEGRTALSALLMTKVAWRRGNAQKAALLGSERTFTKAMSLIEPIQDFPAPRTIWVEFESVSQQHRFLHGTLDRINLMTASPTRLSDFIKAALPVDLVKWGKNLKSILNPMVKAMIEARASMPHSEAAGMNAWRFSLHFSKQAHAKKITHPSYQRMIQVVADAIVSSSACFEKRCKSLED